ncbi:ribosomal protein L7/L12 [Nocardioides sp.]|uniref:ribosomal protein L7/L12 n=1 Tax=Nocardioides sp. TaxID=35761 RepID=UPI002BDD0371|nr:ribosomal protein L7/L12 [Nocardioides sp.]HSX67860.1 ribosomal protein L7/L12 [Nocardioides sp.]
MRVTSALLRLVLGVGVFLVGIKAFGRAVSADWLSWRMPLYFVIGMLGWLLLTGGASLSWGGLLRIPLPGHPEGVYPERQAKKDAEWLRKNADLLEPGDHEVVMTDLGKHSMDVAKAIREATNLDVHAALALVDPVGQLVAHSRSQAAADLIAARLRKAGATAVVRPMAGQAPPETT